MNNIKARTACCIAVVAVACALSFPAAARGETVVDQNIYLEERWVPERGPYIVRGTVTVREGARLEIEPGVEIRLQNLTIPRIDVFGELVAQGTGDAPITLSGEPGMNIYVFGGLARFSHASSSGYFHGHALSGGRLEIADSSFEGGSLYASASSTASLQSVEMRLSHDIQALQGSRLELKGVRIQDSLSASPIRVSGESSLWADELSLKLRPESTGVFVDSSHATITRSSILGGAKGVDAIESEVLVSGSVLEGQSSFSIVNQGPSINLAAAGNYWGDASGPYHPILNPSGQGGQVSDWVEFMPWLSGRPGACCSSVLFLPGLKASRLYMNGANGEEQLWEPITDMDIELLALDETGLSKENVYVKEGDVVEEAYVPLLGPNIYKSFLADLRTIKSEGLIREWKAFSYDWREPVDDLVSSSTLMSLVEGLSNDSKTGKITIVAHSYGGLLAKGLVQALEETGKQGMIDKMILVGSPQLGAPHAIGSVLHGYGEGIPMLPSAKSMRSLAINMPSAYVLMPHGDWPSVVSFSPTSSLPWIRRMRDEFGTVIQDASGVGRFLMDAGEGRGGARGSSLAIPAVLNSFLIDKARSLHETLDSWVPPLGIRLIQVAGKGIETVVGLSYSQGKKYGAPTLLHRPVLSLEGDGVVPVKSSWLIGSRSNVERVWIDLANLNDGSLVDREHADMLEVPELRSYIAGIIGSSPESSPSIVHGEEDQFANQRSATRIFLHASSSKLHIYDSEGKHAGSSQDGLIENEIPGVRYREFGDVSYARVPRVSSNVRIVLRGPFDLEEAVVVEVDEVVGDSVSMSTAFEDLRVPTSTPLLIDVGSSGSDAPLVGVDADDDGDIDLDEALGGEAASGDSVPKAGEDLGSPPASAEQSSTNRRASSGSRSGGSASSFRGTIASVVDPLIYIGPLTEIGEDIGPIASLEATSTSTVPDAYQSQSAPAVLPSVPDMRSGTSNQSASVYEATSMLLARIAGALFSIAKKIVALFDWLF